MKYHKTHPLYKQLPESITRNGQKIPFNPENLSKETVQLSSEDMRKNFGQGQVTAGADTQVFGTVAQVKPIVMGRGRIHDFDRKDVIVARSSVLVPASTPVTTI